MVAVTIAIDRVPVNVTDFLRYDVGARPISGSRATDQITSVQLEFISREGELDKVARGQVIQIYNNGVPRFGGDIDSVRKTQLPADPRISGIGYLLEITAVSALSRFDHLRIPARVYEGMTCGAIVSDLITTVGALEGISLGTVEDGPTLDRVVYDQTPLLDAIRDLATQADFVFDADENLFFQFHERTTVSAPTTLTDDLIRFATPVYYTSRADFRTRQKIRINPAAFRIRRELIGPGDGVETQLDVSRGIGQLLAVQETTATRASVDGTFSGQPSDGDTVSIRSFEYTFKDKLDNREGFQVKIGASVDETAANFVAAINDSLDGKGTNYSWATWAHYNAIAGNPSSGVFTLYAQIPGDEGNGFVEVSSASGAFSWSDTVASGGSGTNGDPLQSGLAGESDVLWTFQQGGKTLTSTGDPLADGSYLLVSFYPLGADTITIEDSDLVAERANIENTSGIYENMIERTDMLDPVEALTIIQGILAAYSNPKEMEIGTDEDGFAPGQLVTIASGQEFGADLNGDWLITQTDFWLDPVMTDLDGTFGENFLRTKIRGIDATRSGNHWRFWERLATVGGGGGVNASAPAQVPPPSPIEFKFGLGTDAESVVLNSTTNKFDIRSPGSYTRWSFIVDEAPVGSDAVIDVLLDAGEVSIFGASPPTLPAGDIKAEGVIETGAFLAGGHYVRGKATSVGTTTAMKRAVLTIY